MKFPARFMLVGALNPTPKGNMPADEISQRAMERYLAKLSGPLVDRIDIHIEVPAVSYRQLTSDRDGTGSAAIREQVLRCRAAQQARQGESLLNAALTGKMLDKFVRLDSKAQSYLGQAMSELGLSARAYDKIRRVSRTIADLEFSTDVQPQHVLEAVQYRLLDRVLV